MAVHTGGRDCLPVVIGMTVGASAGQTQISELFVPDCLCGNELRFMTIATLLFCVGPVQRITGKDMVEFSPVEFHDLKSHSMMIAMAAGTTFSSGFGRRMIPFSLVNS